MLKHKSIIMEDMRFLDALEQAHEMTPEQRQELLCARKASAVPHINWVYCSIEYDNEEPVVRVHVFEEYGDCVDYDQFLVGKGRRFGHAKEIYFLSIFRNIDLLNIVYEGGFEVFLRKLNITVIWKFLNGAQWKSNPFFLPWFYYYYHEAGGLHARLLARKETSLFAVNLDRFRDLRSEKHTLSDIFELPEECMSMIDMFFIERLFERSNRLQAAALYEKYEGLLAEDPEHRRSGVELILEAVHENYPEEDIEKSLIFIRDWFREEDDIYEYFYYLFHRAQLPRFFKTTVSPSDSTKDAAEIVSQAYHCLVAEKDYYSARYRITRNTFYGYEAEDESFRAIVPESLEALWDAGLNLNLGVLESFDSISNGESFILFLVSKDTNADIPDVIGMFGLEGNSIIWAAGKNNRKLSDKELSFLSYCVDLYGGELHDARYHVNRLIEERYPCSQMAKINGSR